MNALNSGEWGFSTERENIDGGVRMQVNIECIFVKVVLGDTESCGGDGVSLAQSLWIVAWLHQQDLLSLSIH